MEEQVPFGLRLIAGGACLIGALGTLGACGWGLIGAGIFVRHVNEPGMGAFTGIVVVAMAFALTLAMATLLAFGIGAWRLHSWAWGLGIAWFSLSALFCLRNIGIELFTPRYGFPPLWINLLGIVITGIALWYLFQPSVRAAFAKP